MNLRLIITVLLVGIGLAALLMHRVSTAEPEMTEEQRKMHEFMGMEFVDGTLVRVREPAIKRFPEPPDPYEGMTVEQKEDAIQQRLKTRAAVSKELYRDLDHYYKVVDQNNQPLAGVKISVNARGFTYIGPLISGYSKRTIELVSDAYGMAHLQARDIDFAASFVKAGYTFDLRSGHLNEEHIVTTSASKPEIIRAYKIPEAALLAEDYPESGGGGYRFIPDGRVVGISLENRKPYPGEQPDLLLRMKRRIDPPPQNGDEYLAWEATIEVPQGGLIETRDKFMFEAPDSGYQPTWSIKHSQEDSKRNGYNGEKRWFYVKARNGQIYAAFSVILDPTNGNIVEEAKAEFSVVFNAHGSRNLYRE